MPRIKTLACKGKGIASSSNENFVAESRRYFNSDEEFAMFEEECLSRKVLGERIFDERVLRRLNFAYLDRLIEWGWMPFLAHKRSVYPNIVRACYFNAELSMDHFATSVLGQGFKVNVRKIRAALGGDSVAKSQVSEPPIRFNYIEACRRIYEDSSITKVVNQVKTLPLHARILHLIVCHTILPRSGKFSVVNRDDIFIMDCIMSNRVPNLPGIIMRHMLKAAENMKKPKLSHGLPYGKLICAMLEELVMINDDEPIAVCEMQPFQLHTIERLGWHYDRASREWVRMQEEVDRQGHEEEEYDLEDEQETRAKIDTLMVTLEELKEQNVQTNRKIDMLIEASIQNHNSNIRIEQALNIPHSSSQFPFPMPPQNP